MCLSNKSFTNQSYINKALCLHLSIKTSIPRVSRMYLHFALSKPWDGLAACQRCSFFDLKQAGMDQSRSVRGEFKEFQGLEWKAVKRLHLSFQVQLQILRLSNVYCTLFMHSVTELGKVSGWRYWGCSYLFGLYAVRTVCLHYVVFILHDIDSKWNGKHPWGYSHGYLQGTR